MLQPVLSQCGALQVWVHIEPPERSWERAVSHHFHPARELERKSYTQANYGRVLGGCYVIFQRQWNGVGLEFQWAHWLKSFLYSRSWAICGGASSLNAGESPLAEKKLTACWDLPAAPVGGFSAFHWLSSTGSRRKRCLDNAVHRGLSSEGQHGAKRARGWGREVAMRTQPD